jgi:hypothetical protein
VEKVKRFYRKESKRRYSSLMWISLEWIWSSSGRVKEKDRKDKIAKSLV